MKNLAYLILYLSLFPTILFFLSIFLWFFFLLLFSFSLFSKIRRRWYMYHQWWNHHQQLHIWWKRHEQPLKVTEWHQWRFLPFRTSNLSGTATAQTLFDEEFWVFFRSRVFYLFWMIFDLRMLNELWFFFDRVLLFWIFFRSRIVLLKILSWFDFRVFLVLPIWI